MEYLNWELSVLSRAVGYKNLSGAAQHVNISQPQLSRIISKLEDAYGVNLLDRDAKRKSGWTKAAFELSDVYTKIFKQFQTDIDQLKQSEIRQRISVGALEGLSALGADLCHNLMSAQGISAVELHIYDQNDIEKKFFSGEIQILLSSRTPGRKKFKYLHKLGYQTLHKVKSKSLVKVMSPFEYAMDLHANSKSVKKHKSFVSNSLAVRKHWLDTYGGTGLTPSPLYHKPKNEENELEVILIGVDELSVSLWNNVLNFYR